MDRDKTERKKRQRCVCTEGWVDPTQEEGDRLQVKKEASEEIKTTHTWTSDF
jgi:hypothetical protein